MNDKRKKSIDEIETLSAGIVLLVMAGMILLNVLIMMIPNEIIRFSIVGAEVLVLLIAGYVLLKAVEDVVDKTR